MSTPTSTTRNIFLVGSTGHQGRALIRALLHPDDPATADPNTYHIYALTRNSTSPAAVKLQESEPDNLTLVQGDLDDPARIAAIFEVLTKNVGGIWGVFCVLAFPGLGVDAKGEEEQGKLIASLALQHHVQVFIYSSALRAGPQNDHDLETDAKAKYNIEQHCEELGRNGLPWIVLRPGLFMESFEEFIGSITASVIKAGLNHDTRVAIVASEDIGNVAASVFRNHEKYLHKYLAVIGEFATMTHLDDIHDRMTGKAMTHFPSGLAKLILQMNKGTRDLNEYLTRMHDARMSNSYVEIVEELALAQSAYDMKKYADWLLVKNGKPKLKTVKSGASAETEPGWNQVSVGKLFTGRM